MKIQATLRQVNDSIPFFKKLANENINYNMGYKLYILSEKLDKVLEYLRDRAVKETAGLSNDEANAKIGEILETRIEIDFEQISRDEFLDALPTDISLSPVAYGCISFIFKPEEGNEEAFKVI